jgi:hypothetical protein
MSHIVGTLQTVSPSKFIGPNSSLDFTPSAAPGGTKLAMLHFRNASFPGNSRLEVDLGYGMDVFTAADGTDFWTRPANIYSPALGGLDDKVPIRYIGSGSVELFEWVRGEEHVGEPGHPSKSNCDPFQAKDVYVEPQYDPSWFCVATPEWANLEKVVPPDIRAVVGRSVGMIVTVETSLFTGIVQLSTCSVTLIDTDKILTAGHCHTPAEALTSSVTFDYRLTDVGKRPNPYTCRWYKVKSVVAHHNSGVFDYSILQLAEAPAGLPVIQIRHDLPGVHEGIFGVHHPNGAPKKLSVAPPLFTTIATSDVNDITVPPSFHASGGSSGSGLFDLAGRVLGVMTGGEPCEGGELEFFPTASIMKDLVPVPPSPVTRDVMVVFDRSGSMSLDDGTGRQKIEAARDALAMFVQLIKSDAGNRLGLVSFSTTPSNPVDHAIDVVDGGKKWEICGNAPFVDHKVAALKPGGMTSIGEGLDTARLEYPAPGVNPRALLLLTDGLQNTPRMIEDVEGALMDIDIHAIGFGTDASLDGAILTELATAHNGLYTRAANGLALEKFFSHAFGNIFENGVLFDPEFDLPAEVKAARPLPFNVCGEDTITVVIGWDRVDGALRINVKTPLGATITGATPGVVESSGRTWSFLRIPLPQGTERDGQWQVLVVRPAGGGPFVPPAPALHYFVSVLPTGGPRLRRRRDPRRYYTGQTITPMVELRYDDDTWPTHVYKVELTVTTPLVNAGTLLSKEGLKPPITIDADTIPARQATLLALEKQAGTPIVPYGETHFEMSSDSHDTGGRFGHNDAVFGKRLEDLLVAEGNYTFHCRATYGEGCTATREAIWSVHVDVGIDPSRTDSIFTVRKRDSGGSSTGTVTFTPRDLYGNNLGPGRTTGISVVGTPGTRVTGLPADNGDGSYIVPVIVEPGADPGVVITQPGGSPTVVTPSRPPAKDDGRR